MSWADQALASVGKQTSNQDVGQATEPCPLIKAALLVGVVRLDTREAVTDVKVVVKGPTAGAKSTSGKHGTALFEPVDPGAYVVQVTLSGEAAETFEKPTDETVSVSGGATQVVLFQLTPPASLVVKVLQKTDQKPIHAAPVEIHGPKGMKLATDGAGIARFARVPVGAYEITIRFAAADKKLYANPAPVRVEVTAGENQATILIGPPAHWIEIELIDDNGDPVANEAYEVELPDGSKRTGKVDGKGRARVDGILAGGTCKVSFPGLGEQVDLQTQSDK
jgi:hypothetical protein